MIAGSLQIQIEAEYAKLEDQLRDVASRSEDAGRKAAERFGARFAESIKGFAKQAAQGLSDEIGKIGKPKQLIAVVAAGLKEAAAGGWQDTLLAGLKSIPIVSAMSDIIESTIKIVTGAAKAEMKAAAESAKADKAYANAKARTDDINARQMQHEDSLLQAKIDNAVAVGDAYAEAYAVADLEFQKIARKRDQDLKKSTDDENGKQRKAIEQTYQDELAAITRAYDIKVSKADDAAMKEAEAQRKAAEDAATAVFEKQQKDADELAKLNRKLADDEMKRQTRMSEEIAKATTESDRARSDAASATGSMATSFGTYTFSAYTDSEKKSNDEKMVAGLKDVVKAIETQSATGGFG